MLLYKNDRYALITIIKTVILLNSIILEDWKIYSSSKNKSYDHKTVNHSKNIIDQNTGAHKQTIEYS